MVVVGIGRSYTEHVKLLTTDQRQILKDAVKDEQTVNLIKRSVLSNLPIVISVGTHLFPFELEDDLESLQETLSEEDSNG